MNIQEKIARVALILLATFVVSAVVAGTLFAFGTLFWVPFACLSIATLIASYVLGSD